jgi:diamine N-acetyltransferase
MRDFPAVGLIDLFDFDPRTIGGRDCALAVESVESKKYLGAMPFNTLCFYHLNVHQLHANISTEKQRQLFTKFGFRVMG